MFKPIDFSALSYQLLALKNYHVERDKYKFEIL